VTVLLYVACELLVKMKKILQDNNQQSRITSLNAAEIGICETTHDPKFISALEEWYLRKVCHFLIFISLST